MGPYDDLDALVGPPVGVTEEMLTACRASDQFGPLVFELYKEAASLVCVSSAVHFGNAEDSIKLERNQAICAGLLVRISKYMASIAKLSADNEHGETIQALNRCIIESAVNLRYLVLKNEEEVYDRFVNYSLVAERELYDFIQANISASAGQQLHIEQNMLSSIIDTCEQSGVAVEEINPKPGSWGGSFRDKLTFLGYDWPAYTILERIPSHAIHGDWVDLFKNHLQREQDGFVPNYDRLNSDGGLLGSMGVFVVEAARDYLGRYFDSPDAEPLQMRLSNVQERLMAVESARDDWQVVE